MGGRFNLAATVDTGFGGIGFSRRRNATSGAGGVISPFSLTQVHEPGAFAMVGIGVSLVVARQRRRN